MNQVNGVDVTFMSLALADFTGVSTALIAHDYTVAGGLFVVGVGLVYLYHRFGSPTLPPQ